MSIQVSVKLGFPPCGRIVLYVRDDGQVPKEMAGHKFHVRGMRKGNRQLRFERSKRGGYGLQKGRKIQGVFVRKVEVFPAGFKNVNLPKHFGMQWTTAIWNGEFLDVDVPTKLKEPKASNGRVRKAKPGIVVGHDMRDAVDPLAVGEEELEYMQRKGVVARDGTLEENSRFVTEREANNTEDELAAVVAHAMPSTGREYALVQQTEEPIKKGFFRRFFGL